MASRLSISIPKRLLLRLSPGTRLLLEIAKLNWIWITITVILSFLSGIFNGISVALLVPAILLFFDNGATNSAPAIVKQLVSVFDIFPPEYRTIATVTAIVGAIILKNLLMLASTAANGHLSRSLVNEASFRGLRTIFGVGIDYFSNTKAGDLIQRIGTETSGAVGTINTLVQIVAISITLFTFVGVLVSISWQITLLSLGFAAVVILANRWFAQTSRELGRQAIMFGREYSSQLVEVLGGIRLIKSVSSENLEYDRLTQTVFKKQRVELRSQTFRQIIASANEMMTVVALLAIVAVGQWVFRGQDYSAVLLTYIFLLSRVFGQVTALGKAVNNLALCMVAVDAMVNFIRRDNKHAIADGFEPYRPLREGIRFEGVTFSYPSHPRRKVLDRVDLFIPCGTTLAVVGESGGGKSTLVDLLVRFYDPLQGRLTFDGRDLRDITLESLHGAMGIVSQDTFLFNNTVRYNIAYGCGPVTDEQIEMAARRANAYDFIQDLPKGFETPLGDRGVRLSGGQQQRLAIARALLRDPDILILDEATSALDTVSERQVQQAIAEVCRDRTTITIAHRLSTIRDAHQIAVFDQGRLVELGNHDDLLAKNGHYARLYAMQFSGGQARTSVHCENAMESMVLQEVLAQFAGRENQGSPVRSDLSSVMAFALNHLPPLYATTNEGINFQRQHALDQCRDRIAEQVSNAITHHESHDDPSRDRLVLSPVTPPIGNQPLRIVPVSERLSYEVRGRLNVVLGSLGLLADDLVDQAQEQYDLLRESYRASLQMLAALELLDETLAVQRDLLQVSGLGGNLSERRSQLLRICRELQGQAERFSRDLEILVSEVMGDVLVMDDAPLVDRSRTFRSLYNQALELLGRIQAVEKGS
ncbi:MAG: ATP-binding cassette domain-containing protein [Cyanobacteria bacterium]|nr:ATP-binding cassette domain-containing protein [Cyanobacteriota bacterium]